MARSSQPDWTLLYMRGRGGEQQPIAQVSLRDDFNLARLRTETLPDVLQKMSKRARRWSVMMVDESVHDGQLALWDRPEAARRLLWSVQAWVAVCAESNLNDDVALRMLHSHTLEECCGCLLGRAPEGINLKSPPTGRITAALEAFLKTNQRPETL